MLSKEEMLRKVSDIQYKWSLLSVDIDDDDMVLGYGPTSPTP